MIVNAMFTSWLASLNLVSVIRILPVSTSTRQKMTNEAKRGKLSPAVLHSIVQIKFRSCSIQKNSLVQHTTS